MDLWRDRQFDYTWLKDIPESNVVHYFYHSMSIMWAFKTHLIGLRYFNETGKFSPSNRYFDTFGKFKSPQAFTLLKIEWSEFLQYWFDIRASVTLGDVDEIANLFNAMRQREVLNNNLFRKDYLFGSLAEKDIEFINNNMFKTRKLIQSEIDILEKLTIAEMDLKVSIISWMRSEQWLEKYSNTIAETFFGPTIEPLYEITQMRQGMRDVALDHFLELYKKISAVDFELAFQKYEMAASINGLPRLAELYGERNIRMMLYLKQNFSKDIASLYRSYQGYDVLLEKKLKDNGLMKAFEKWDLKEAGRLAWEWPSEVLIGDMERLDKVIYNESIDLLTKYVETKGVTLDTTITEDLFRATLEGQLGEIPNFKAIVDEKEIVGESTKPKFILDESTKMQLESVEEANQLAKGRIKLTGVGNEEELTKYYMAKKEWQFMNVIKGERMPASTSQMMVVGDFNHILVIKDNAITQNLYSKSLQFQEFIDEFGIKRNIMHYNDREVLSEALEHLSQNDKLGYLDNYDWFKHQGKNLNSADFEIYCDRRFAYENYLRPRVKLGTPKMNMPIDASDRHLRKLIADLFFSKNNELERGGAKAMIEMLENGNNMMIEKEKALFQMVESREGSVLFSDIVSKMGQYGKNVALKYLPTILMTASVFFDAYVVITTAYEVTRYIEYYVDHPKESAWGDILTNVYLFAESVIIEDALVDKNIYDQCIDILYTKRKNIYGHRREYIPERWIKHKNKYIYADPDYDYERLWHATYKHSRDTYNDYGPASIGPITLSHVHLSAGVKTNWIISHSLSDQRSKHNGGDLSAPAIVSYWYTKQLDLWVQPIQFQFENRIQCMAFFFPDAYQVNEKDKRKSHTILRFVDLWNLFVDSNHRVISMVNHAMVNKKMPKYPINLRAEMDSTTDEKKWYKSFLMNLEWCYWLHSLGSIRVIATNEMGFYNIKMDATRYMRGGSLSKKHVERREIFKEDRKRAKERDRENTTPEIDVSALKIKYEQKIEEVKQIIGRNVRLNNKLNEIINEQYQLYQVQIDKLDKLKNEAEVFLRKEHYRDEWLREIEYYRRKGGLNYKELIARVLQYYESKDPDEFISLYEDEKIFLRDWKKDNNSDMVTYLYNKDAMEHRIRKLKYSDFSEEYFNNPISVSEIEKEKYESFLKILINEETKERYINQIIDYQLKTDGETRKVYESLILPLHLTKTHWSEATNLYNIIKRHEEALSKLNHPDLTATETLRRITNIEDAKKRNYLLQIYSSILAEHPPDNTTFSNHVKLSWIDLLTEVIKEEFIQMTKSRDNSSSSSSSGGGAALIGALILVLAALR